MSATQILAEFALDPALEAPPRDVMGGAAACMLDSLGCALGGMETWIGQQIIAFGLEQGGHPHATVIGGHGTKLPPMLASLVNGHLANALDFDDTYLDIGHTGTAVFPAALAIGEQVNASGEALRAAIIAGYEVANRIGLAARPNDERYRLLYPVGWHSFGATAAAGRLLGLDQIQMEHAFGITLEHMQVATTITTDTVHGFKAGKLGQSSAIGVLAASLAARGFEGKRSAVDESGMFWLAMGADRIDPQALTDELGTRWTINEMSFKPFPSCRMTHPALQAAAILKREYQVEPADIQSIRVRTFGRMMQLMDPEPASSASIPFSMPSTMSMLLRGIPRGADWADISVALHPDTVEIAHRIEVVSDEQFDRVLDETGALPAEVSFELVDGRTLSHTEMDAPWGPLEQQSSSDLMPKFLGMAQRVLGDEAVKLAEEIQSIATDNPSSARQITEILCPTPLRG